MCTHSARRPKMLRKLLKSQAKRDIERAMRQPKKGNASGKI
jgi:hypothetical protein